MNGECDVVIAFATDEPAERFVEYAAREGMPVEIQRTGSSACGKRARNDFAEPECAQWLSEMVNDGPAQKRAAIRSDDGRDSLFWALDAVTARSTGATQLVKALGESTHQQMRSPSSDGKLIKRKRIQFEQPSRPPAIADKVGADADVAEQASAKA